MATKKKAPANKSDIRIVILQRGWVYVGRYSQDGEDCRLDGASNIRVWGTTKGLGQLATSGPLPGTTLDPCPPLRFHELTVIATIDCDPARWASVCAA
jgi:hypothetical protein